MRWTCKSTTRLAAESVRQGHPASQRTVCDLLAQLDIGDFANRGREWRPKAQPETVRVHDFADAELGKVVPYGVYDLTDDQLATVALEPDAFHGEWNCTIKPSSLSDLTVRTGC